MGSGKRFGRRYIMPTMETAPFSASGKSFSIREWRGSGPPSLHVHHSDDEAWHVLEGELSFRYRDRTETVCAGKTVFVPAGVAHTYTAGPGARYLIILTPRVSALIAALQAERDFTRHPEIYRRFDSELLE
jgi:mannose-6-phosphate isomerase-like protein (cupin superfamily)